MYRIGHFGLGIMAVAVLSGCGYQGESGGDGDSLSTTYQKYRSLRSEATGSGGENGKASEACFVAADKLFRKYGCPSPETMKPSESCIKAMNENPEVQAQLRQIDACAREHKHPKDCPITGGPPVIPEACRNDEPKPESFPNCRPDPVFEALKKCLDASGKQS